MEHPGVHTDWLRFGKKVEKYLSLVIKLIIKIYE